MTFSYLFFVAFVVQYQMRPKAAPVHAFGMFRLSNHEEHGAA